MTVHTATIYFELTIMPECFGYYFAKECIYDKTYGTYYMYM